MSLLCVVVVVVANVSADFGGHGGDFPWLSPLAPVPVVRT